MGGTWIGARERLGGLDRSRLFRAWLIAWPILALAALAVIGIVTVHLADNAWNNDARGFWLAWRHGLYSIPWLDHGAYVYSPAFAEAIWPWTRLAWPTAWTIWAWLQMGVLVGMLGPVIAVLAIAVPWPSLPDHGNAVYATIVNGNPQILLAAAIALGMRWPAAWSFVLLTKVTPGVGVLWFALRREWRSFLIALGATALVVAASFIVAPQLWIDWVGLLAQASRANTLQKEPILPLPFIVRLPIALAVLTFGALTNRRWLVPIACTLALPAIQLGGFAILVAAIPLWLHDAGLGWLLWPWMRPTGASPPQPGRPDHAPEDPA